jgi:hypothetical protein
METRLQTLHFGMFPHLRRAAKEKSLLADELVVVPRDADPQQASMLAINPVSADLFIRLIG